MQRVTMPNEVLLPEVERMLDKGLSVTLKVKGKSMLPFIVGDRDSVVLTRTERPDKGDIVLARIANNRYVIHRIIAMQGDNAILRGDGNIIGTECCNIRNICGKVTTIIKKEKQVNVDSLAEKRKAALWERLRPIRRYLLAIYRIMNKR